MSRLVEQQSHHICIQEELLRLRQRNESLEAELHDQQTNYNLVIGDMVRICDEKQRILEQRDSESFQKEMNNLILDQYQDEVTEQKKAIDAKDAGIRELEAKSTRLEAEISSLLRNQRRYEQCRAESQHQHEAVNLGTPPKRRSGRGRKHNRGKKRHLGARVHS